MSSMKASGFKTKLALLLLGSSVLFEPMSVARAESDGYDCGYVAPMDSTLIANSADLQPARIRSAVLNLRLHNLVVNGAPPGASGWSNAQIAAAIERVRSDFAECGIYLNISVHPLGVTSELYYSYSYPSAILDDRLGPPTDAIDAVLAFAAPGSIRPAGYAWGADSGSVVAKRCRAQILADEDFPVLSHEIGHCIGLLHTNHQPNNPQYRCDERSLCTGCQDRVCDTPFDRYLEEPMWNYVDKNPLRV